MKYIIYTADKSLTDAEFLSLGSDYTLENGYNKRPLNAVRMASRNNHRVAVVNACQDCIDQYKVPSIEFLCCKDGMDCCHDDPTANFTEDDWLKVDLADARGLFEPIPLPPEPEPLTVEVTQEDIDRVTNYDIDYVFTDRDWIVVRMLKDGFELESD